MICTHLDDIAPSPYHREEKRGIVVEVQLVNVRVAHLNQGSDDLLPLFVHARQNPVGGKLDLFRSFAPRNAVFVEPPELGSAVSPGGRSEGEVQRRSPLAVLDVHHERRRVEDPSVLGVEPERARGTSEPCVRGGSSGWRRLMRVLGRS